MSMESVPRQDLRDGAKPRLTAASGRGEAGPERASELRAARRQAERRQATVVAQWLRKLYDES
jgi:hypothetical protein